MLRWHSCYGSVALPDGLIGQAAHNSNKVSKGKTDTQALHSDILCSQLDMLKYRQQLETQQSRTEDFPN